MLRVTRTAGSTAAVSDARTPRVSILTNVQPAAVLLPASGDAKPLDNNTEEGRDIDRLGD
jgi:hypothetical protein